MLLLPCFGTLGREFECSYQTYSNTLWPLSRCCKLYSVDLSVVDSSKNSSFTGTVSEKSQTKVVWFNWGSSSINFVPKDSVSEFKNLNGLIFTDYNSPEIKNNIFTKDFIEIEYLHLGENQIETIQSNAFEHLTKLKWLNLWKNQIKNLSFKIFANNLEMIHIAFGKNQIFSINPNFFKGLNKLKYVNFGSNQCFDKDIGCETCSISQSALNSELSYCFSNCRSDSVCSSHVEQETTTTEMIENTEATKKEMDFTTTEMETQVIESTANTDLDIAKTIKKEVTMLSSEIKKLEEKAVEKFDKLKEGFLKIFS